MSAETIIAQLEADFANISNEGKSALLALFSRVTAIENAVTAAGGPIATALGDASSLATQALSAGATVATAATNPVAAAVAIGNLAAPVTNLFVEAYDGALGYVEGLEGKTPKAGASTAEQIGDAAGVATRNIFDAIIDAVEGKNPPAPTNPSGAVGG